MKLHKKHLNLTNGECSKTNDCCYYCPDEMEEVL